MAEAHSTYIVYMPDGRQVTERTRRAHGKWAIANVSFQRGSWAVAGIYDACDADTIASDGMMVATAERIEVVIG